MHHHGGLPFSNEYFAEKYMYYGHNLGGNRYMQVKHIVANIAYWYVPPRLNFFTSSFKNTQLKKNIFCSKLFTIGES